MNNTYEKVYVLDTNVILNNAYNLITLSDAGNNLIILPEIVLDELDDKKNGFDEINFQARNFAGLLKDAKIIKHEKTEILNITTVDVDGCVILMIAKDSYKADKEHLSNSIRNDRKILEVTQDAMSIYKDLVFISLDVMARTRAISLGLNTEPLTLGKIDADNDIDFHCELNIPEFSSVAEIPYDLDNKISSVEVTNTSGKKFYFFKTNNRWKEMGKDNHYRLPVPPINIRQKMMSELIMSENDVNVVSGPAGCSLPGSNVEIQPIQNFISSEDIKLKLNITTTQLKRLRLLNGIQFNRINTQVFLYDENSVDYCILKIVKSTFNMSTFYQDKKYKSKYLTLKYWLGFNDVEFSHKKVRFLRSQHISKYFENLSYSQHNTFNKENFQKSLMKIQSILIYTNININNITQVQELKYIGNVLNVEYWTLRGFSKEDGIKFAKESQLGRQCTTEIFWTNKGYTSSEAKVEVQKIQSSNSKRKLNKYTNKELRVFSHRCIEYWIAKGYTKEESVNKIKEVQSTFSLEKCIKKHGEIEGLKIFNQRQEKWQSTLKSKPQEEIDRINKNKSKCLYKPSYFERCDTNSTQSAILYYIKFYNDDIVFYKIGITTRTIKQRFDTERNIKRKHNLKMKVIKEDTMSIYQAYIKEQEILSKYRKHRIDIKYNGFNSSECFSKDVLCS